MIRLTPLVCAALMPAALMMAAGSARAETPQQPSGAPVTPIPPAVDGSAFRTPLGLTVSQAEALRAAGLAQTSVDHHFAGQSIVGSFGFLCGLQAPYAHAGIADARGYDPDGKFVGAKLAFAFK